ncbi:MAG: TIM barrel protein [Verrucomicrobiales bacterium]|jgi:sugar phosphate isomerase/epimerase|nr:TIM barrel protein [Verrucomicrobiales bacterium]
MNRRHALRTFALSAGATAPFLSSCSEEAADESASGSEPWLKLAVQQYSFNKELQSGALTIPEYPQTVVEGTGIKALEYFNGHMEEQAGKVAFFQNLRQRTDDLGAVNTMILCRSKPALDSPDPAVRAAAIEGYRPWLEAMQILGGQCIRVDVRSPGDPEEQKKHAIEGLRALSTVAGDEFGLAIVVENHGNHSSNGAWVAEVMKGVDIENCGTLPDFQNFKEYDPYQGVGEMMPWAKIVCAKAKDFDAAGNETNVDYRRMLKIVKESGFRGYIGIEFEGHGVPPVEGINLTKNLIETVIGELA